MVNLSEVQHAVSINLCIPVFCERFWRLLTNQREMSAPAGDRCVLLPSYANLLPRHPCGNNLSQELRSKRILQVCIEVHDSNNSRCRDVARYGEGITVCLGNQQIYRGCMPVGHLLFS